MSEKSSLSSLNYYYSSKNNGQKKAVRVWPRLKKPAIWAGLACLGIIILQFLYPWDMTLPGARYGQTEIGVVSLEEAATTLNSEFSDWSRTLEAGENQYEVKSGDVGLSLNADSTVSEKLSYHWWQRLVPGSIIARMVVPDSGAVVDADGGSLDQFADKLQVENYKPYANAEIIVQNGEASIKPEDDGRDFIAAKTVTQLKEQFFRESGELELVPETLSPVIKSTHAEPTLNDTDTILATLPKYSIGSQNGEISKPQLGTWLTFTADEANRRIDIGLDASKVEGFVYGVYPYTYSDGLVGDEDEAVSFESAVRGFDNIVKLKGLPLTVEVTSVEVTNEMRNGRGYSPSQAGLQALLQDIADEKGEYAIAVQELGGRGWAASASGDEEFTPASTYKLFVAYSVLKKIEAGEWTWGGRVAGTSVEQCFNVMIINSNNTCAEAFGNLIGWKVIESQMRDLGLSKTTLNSGAFISTANDELIFMAKLGRGEILSQASRDKLIEVMKQQVYRDGIPAGAGVPVADKVGFLYGLLHDAALVYSPNGTYALIILTNNSSWGEIADAAAKIQQHLD